MLGFEGFEFIVEAVIFGVGDNRAAEDVVAIDVEVELCAQFGVARLEDVFIRVAADATEAGGRYRDVASERRTVNRLG